MKSENASPTAVAVAEIIERLSVLEHRVAALEARRDRAERELDEMAEAFRGDHGAADA